MRDIILEYCIERVNNLIQQIDALVKIPWIAVTQLSPLFAILVSPHKPIMYGSLDIQAIIRANESGYTFVSAST